MKHLKIIITLTIVVLISVVAIFFVEKVTSEVIRLENIRLANIAKYEVLPELVASDLLLDDGITPLPPLDIDYGDSTITEIFFIEGKGYIYVAEFRGYQSQIVYMVGIDLEERLTGFKVLVQAETVGYGYSISDEDYRLQFEGLSVDNALNGEIDDVAGISGAPVTMGMFRQSLEELMTYHLDNYTDTVVETPEQELERWRDEITVVDAIFTDISEDYTMDETVVKMEIANDGTDDVAVLYTVHFSGFVSTGYVEYLISFDINNNDIIGLRVTHNDETAGIGAILSDESFTPQFDDMLQADALGGEIDEVAGGSAPITYNAFRASLEEVVLFHQAIYQVEPRADNVEVTNENLLLAFPEGITFTSVYVDYSYDESIGNIYEVYDGSSELLGYVYYVEYYGYNLEDGVSFVLGIDVLGTTNLIEVLSMSESWDEAELHGSYDGLSGYFPDVVWLDDFEGVSILDLLIDPVDEIAGVSTTTGNMIEVIEKVFQYHILELVGGAN